MSNQKVDSRIIKLEEHKKELKNLIFRKLHIKQSCYERLEKIAVIVKKTPNETIEGIINEMYQYLQEGGDV